jgi:Domain of unknown function (DUF4115)
LDQAARELGIPTKILRAIEWDRRDLLGNVRDVDRIERQYAAFLGLEPGPSPAVEAAEPPPSPRRAWRGVRVAFLVGVAPLLVVALVYALLDVMAGRGESDSTRQPEPRVTSSVEASDESEASTSEASTNEERPAVRPRQRRANLVITAGLGGSWVEAHSGSQTGPLLFRGTVTPGRRLRLAAEERIWVRLGAASNLSLAVNGRPAPIELQGTLDVFVTAKGIEPA